MPVIPMGKVLCPCHDPCNPALAKKTNVFRGFLHGVLTDAASAAPNRLLQASLKQRFLAHFSAVFADYWMPIASLMWCSGHVIPASELESQDDPSSAHGLDTQNGLGVHRLNFAAQRGIDMALM